MTGLEKTTNSEILYDDSFYQQMEKQAKLAAPAVFEILKPLIKPDSVLDIGCGYGSWLRSADANRSFTE